MTKIVAALLSMLILTSLVPVDLLAQGGQPVIVTDLTSKGVLRISQTPQSEKKLKLMIEKDGSTYYYDLKSGLPYEDFPLVMGNGQYKATVLENTTGNRYKAIVSKTFDVELQDQYQPFLQSTQLVKWHENMAPIKKARELTQSITDPKAKVKAIYDFIVQNISYDSDKMNSVSTGYLPDIETIFNQKKGICYDYASLFAAMLRSVGVPAKLVKGNSDNAVGYHAWNEVLLDNQWVIIDATYGAQALAKNQSDDMIKPASKYSKANEN